MPLKPLQWCDCDGRGGGGSANGRLNIVVPYVTSGARVASVEVWKPMKKRRTKGEPVGSECRRLGNGRYSVSGQAGRPEPLYRSRLSVPPHLYPLCPLSIDVVAIIIIRFSYHWSLLLYSQKRRRLIGSRLWHVFLTSFFYASADPPWTVPTHSTVYCAFPNLTAPVVRGHSFRRLLPT